MDACIQTFSWKIEEFVLANFDCKKITSIWSATGETPVYCIEYKGKRFAFFKTYVGAPASVANLEDALQLLDTDKFILFGGAGCLNKEIARGKVMVPTAAYRDEGTSYHYAPAADYITVKNADIVASFMEEAGLPYVKGKTWTTDAFYRETPKKIEARKNMGAICVEMECAAMQALCDFRGVDFFQFLYAGDNLDHSNWDPRSLSGTARLDDKQKIALLAFELAASIAK